MNDFKNNVKQVMIIFLVFFIALISYIAYFQTFKAPDIAEDPGNKRIWAKRNEVVRGTIYDRNKTPLTTSEITGTLTQSREYLYGDLFAHVVGYADMTYDVSGLEKTFDEELTNYSSLQVGFRNFLSDISVDSLVAAFKDRSKVEQKTGNGVVTTLDLDLQKVAYDALGNKKGAVVAIDPKSGEVLAMVSKPTFDPNNLKIVMDKINGGEDLGSPLINRVTYGQYPPGSTFKVITTASALENINGVTSRIFEDRGKIEFGNNQSLSNSQGAVHGNIDLRKAFQVSSNVVYGTLAQELGNSNLKSTAESFGFNKNIPSIGFSMAQSKFPTLESYETGMIAQSGIGQSSITATPMEMALVAAAISNDGLMMQPRLVNEVVDLNMNSVKKYSSKKHEQVIPPSDAKLIKEYMVNMVKYNFSSKPYFKNCSVAGKTGTADQRDGNGNLQKPHGWFIGFAPAENPQIAVAVIVENGGYGADAAAPIAGSVIRKALGK